MFAGQEAPPRYWSETGRDGDVDGAVADPALVAEAWQAWRSEVAFAEEFRRRGAGPRHDGAISLREVLVHMVEEYARHNGHAGLLRERIDGRVGQ